MLLENNQHFYRPISFSYNIFCTIPKVNTPPPTGIGCSHKIKRGCLMRIYAYTPPPHTIYTTEPVITILYHPLTHRYTGNFQFPINTSTVGVTLLMAAGKITGGKILFMIFKREKYSFHFFHPVKPYIS